MTAALEGGEWSAALPSRTLPPGKTRYPLCRGLGGPLDRSGQVRKNLFPTGIRSRTVEPVGQSLYWLRYPAYIRIYIYIYYILYYTHYILIHKLKTGSNEFSIISYPRSSVTKSSHQSRSILPPPHSVITQTCCVVSQLLIATGFMPHDINLLHRVLSTPNLRFKISNFVGFNANCFAFYVRFV